jgi:hypothetical protein
MRQNIPRCVCTTSRMHQHEADSENALECVKMHHIQNAAGQRMHRNAHTARSKNAAVENANKGGLECMKMQQIPEMQHIQNALKCIQMHCNAQKCIQMR